MRRRHNNIDPCVIGRYVEYSSRYGFGFAGGIGHYGNGDGCISRYSECVLYYHVRRGGCDGNGSDHACGDRRHGNGMPGIGHDTYQQRGRRHMDYCSGNGQRDPYRFGHIYNRDRNNSG